MSISKIVLEYTYDMLLYCLGLLHTTTEERVSCNRLYGPQSKIFSLCPLQEKFANP